MILLSRFMIQKRIKPNGAIYINKTKEFLKHRTLFRIKNHILQDAKNKISRY